MTTSWADGPLAAFDLETTGVDPEEARIVTASLVAVRPGQKPQVQEWLADPGVEIPEAASAVHGITTEHAKAHGKPALEVAVELYYAINQLRQSEIPVVIYNASYDLTVLDRELRRHTTSPGQLGEIGAIVDPLVLDRAMDPYRKGSGTRKLTYVCQNVYNVPLSDEDAHGSSADALAAARVAWKIAKRYPAIGENSISFLQGLQAEYHHKWAENFGAYLIRQGKPDDVCRDWPIRPYTEPNGALIPAPEAVPARGGLL